MSVSDNDFHNAGSDMSDEEQLENESNIGKNDTRYMAIFIKRLKKKQTLAILKDSV